MVRLRISFAMLVILALATSACSGSVNFSFGGQTPAEAAEELIEGEAMAQRIGVGTITDAVCEEPSSNTVGTVFSCSSQSDGQTIDFEVAIEEEDRIFARPTNVVDPAGLERLETVAVQELNRSNGLRLPPEALDCGDQGAILDSDGQMICALTDPETGIVFDAQVRVTNTQTGDFTIVILGEASS